MKTVMRDLVHADQVGFTPGSESRDNRIRTLLAVQKIKEGKSPGLLLSIDAKKAVDRVDWGFMQNTLKEMGLGPRMAQQIEALYNQPSARVKVNGTVSKSFEMYNGMRQECLSHPLMALEPLLAGIRQNPDIKGIRIGDEEHKLEVYADNILVYITSPRITLPNLMKILKAYGEVSNFKLNPSKSEILNINMKSRYTKTSFHLFGENWN